MNKFIIVASIEANIDMYELESYIKNKLKSHSTADSYMKGIEDAIHKLSSYADSVGANEYVQRKFGLNARHITFKKMAIIFRIHGKYVYIKQIIPMSLIY